MRIGPHEILGELGRGGMGVVYRVRTPDGREAALKVLERLAPDRFARFERERRLLASLGEQEGFVGLLDAGAAAGAAWLLMPLVPGGTLRDRLARGPLGVSETISLGLELARALGAAHARGIVHRDLKPENILFTAAGRPLVADLGLAKHFDRGAPGASQSVSLSRHGVARGTAGYMAPEQLEDAASVGPPADVFSLGVVLYECLAGRPAFEGDSALEVLSSMTSGVRKAIGRPEVPAWLEKTILRALATERSERFPDGASFARALSNPEKPRRRFVLPALLGAAIGAGVLALVLRGGEPRPQPPRSQPPPPRPSVPRPAPPSRAPFGERLDELDRESSALPNASGQHVPVPEQLLALTRETFARLEKDDLLPGERTRALDRLTALSSWLAYNGTPESLDLAESFSLVLLPLDREKPARQLQLRAVSLVARQHYEEALAVQDEMIQRGLFPAGLHVQRAFALAGAGRGEDEALKELARSPGDAVKEAGQAVSGLARCVELRGKAEDPRVDATEALVAVEQALAAFEGNGDAFFVRGALRERLGDRDGAYADYTRAHETRCPKAAMAIANRAAHEKATGAAIDDFSRAIDLEPGNDRFYLSRGSLKAKDGDLEGGLGDFEKAEELCRTNGRPEEDRRRVAALIEEAKRRLAAPR